VDRRSFGLTLAALAFAGSSGRAVPACPSGMAPIEGRYCIDRYEDALVEVTPTGLRGFSPYSMVGGKLVRAVSQRGRVPQGYISGREAARACSQAGKRLCTLAEWRSACLGPQKLTWSYGPARIDGMCNDKRALHPITELFGPGNGPNVWNMDTMNDPRVDQLPHSVSRSGAYPLCTNSYGVYDMVGNLEEWIADPDGTFVGGFFVEANLNGQGCYVTTTAHEMDYHDYSTGFRCCADLY
jgi:formylglycine-generating enzyme